MSAGKIFFFKDCLAVMREVNEDNTVCMLQGPECGDKGTGILAESMENEPCIFSVTHLQVMEPAAIDMYKVGLHGIPKNKAKPGYNFAFWIESLPGLFL